jgi:CheY-like chemotaxis protein
MYSRNIEAMISEAGMPATILVIEDALDYRDIVCRMLRSRGFEVLESAPGPEAVDRAEQVVPDLIMVGLSLPGNPGWETARTLRTRAKLERTPMIGTTVLTTLISPRQARSIGCVDRIDSPANLDELIYHVEGLLAQAA